MIVEDNWPIGEGDCYSIRHMREGVGFVDLQMSKMYLGTYLQQKSRNMLKKQLLKFYYQQTRIVNPNSSDFPNYTKNVTLSEEINPVFLEETNNWGLKYTGTYGTKEPLLSKRPFDGYDYSYSNLTYIRLR